MDVLEADPVRARDAAIPLSRQRRAYASTRALVTRGPYAFSGGFASPRSRRTRSYTVRLRTIERSDRRNSRSPRLREDGLYATFGSVRDARFAAGTPIEAFVTAPRETAGETWRRPRVLSTKARVCARLLACVRSRHARGRLGCRRPPDAGRTTRPTPRRSCIGSCARTNASDARES